jgi:ABC-type transport system involved in multi-copper enzyme maturation permease subunit
MLKSLKWKVIMLLAIISTITFIIGFGSALSISSSRPKETTNTDNGTETKHSKTESPDQNYYNILVLGDSLAKGTGDEKGLGFPGYFSDYWKSK